MRKIILLIKGVLFIVIVFSLVGCRSRNGGSEEVNFDFYEEVKFVKDKLGITDEIFAEIIVCSLEQAGMTGRIMHIEALGSERRPHSTLEVVSADGRTYRLWTGGGVVEAVFDAETEEVLLQMIGGRRNDEGNINE